MAETRPSTQLAEAADAVTASVISEVRALVGTGRPLDAPLIDAAARGWSANTRRAFRSDLLLWGRWCQRKDVIPASAAPSLVAAWVRALAGIDAPDGKIRAMATIERYLVHVGWAYRMAGIEDPTGAPLVRFELKAARKHLGTRQRQARAIRYKGEISDLDSPAAGICLTHLLQACRRDLLGLRDAALLRIAYDSGARRSELVGIRLEDIDGPDGEGAGTLFLPRGKTDQEGEGAWAYLSPATLRAIEAWRMASGIKRGALLRRVHTHFDGSIAGVGEGALHPNSIALIYRRLALAAFDRKLLGPMSETEIARAVAAISSHSIRVGVAQDNFAASESLPAIMQAYRWRDARTVMRYGARLAAKSGASARLAKRFADE